MKTQAQPADIAMELNARFRGPLNSYFSRRIRNQAEVEDLVQEVLLKVLRASASPDIRHAEAYIFTTARNLLRDRHRQAVRQGVQGYLSIEEAEALQADGHLVEEITPERVLIGRDALSDVLAALAELGVLTRNIFILFRLENMKQKDIAALYGIGQSTVEKHVMKAMLHLTTRVER
jgi:RNA polymerase sigma-70 factor (ECF subfamily)